MGSSGSGAVLTPDDLVRQVVPGQVHVRADRVVYTLRRVDGRGERTDLWTVPLDGGPPRALTQSPGQDHRPVLSPDGSQVAFLRTGGDDPTRLVVLDLATGSLAEPGSFDRDVLDVDWSPDGTWLVVLVEDDRSTRVHRADRGPDLGVGPEEPPTALVLTTADWRADGESGHGLRLYPRHLHRVDLADGASSRLTEGPWSAARPRVGPDGSVHFLADRRPDADLAPAAQVCRVGPERGAPPWAGTPDVSEVTCFAGGVVRFHPLPEGLRVLAHTSAQPADHEPPRLFDVHPGEPPVAVPGHESQWLGLLGDETDLHDWHLELDDAAGTTVHSGGGSSRPVEAGTGRPLVDGPVVCGAVSQDGDRRVAVLAAGQGPVAPDLFALEDDGPRRLTRHGDWLDAAGLRMERVVVPGVAGDVTVHLLHPPDAGSTPGPRATVLAVHGGPTGQWGVVPTLEAVLLAGAGYLVAMPNIRGSLDRGPDWVRALGGAWGDVDADDALAVCDHLVAHGLGDPDRLGVSGLSYGGFLTQWLVGRTDRFAAAVSENGVSNQVAAWGSCDTGPAYCRAAGLGEVVTAVGTQQLWRTSPLRLASQVRTPLLMLQAADDRTCPASDNEQLFVALRHLRRTVEYVLYPEESHLMQATGRIDRRIDRHRRALAWFERFMAP